jgi:hypothetical protein
VYQSAGVGSMNPNTSESNIPDRQYKTFAWKLGISFG